MAVEFNDLTQSQQRDALAAARAALDPRFGWIELGEPTVVTAVAIAGAESSFNRNAAGDRPEDVGPTLRAQCEDINCLNFCSWGLWQIFMPIHVTTILGFGGPDARQDPCAAAQWLQDPANNQKAARAAFDDQVSAGVNGFNAFTTFRTGAFEEWLPAARTAVARAQGTSPMLLAGVGLLVVASIPVIASLLGPAAAERGVS